MSIRVSSGSDIWCQSHFALLMWGQGNHSCFLSQKEFPSFSWRVDSLLTDSRRKCEHFIINWIFTETLNFAAKEGEEKKEWIEREGVRWRWTVYDTSGRMGKEREERVSGRKKFAKWETILRQKVTVQVSVLAIFCCMCFLFPSAPFQNPTGHTTKSVCIVL